MERFARFLLRFRIHLLLLLTLVTLFLAWPPVEIAARLWFGLNLSMLLASAWLLTDNWKPTPRLASFLIAIIFIPVIGSLYVGQFIFPVLLGASLMTFALRRENVPLTALAAALLTFKPHLGGPLAAAALIYLFLRRDDFSRRAIRAILVTAVSLFAVGFLGSVPFESWRGQDSQARQCWRSPGQRFVR